MNIAFLFLFRSAHGQSDRGADHLYESRVIIGVTPLLIPHACITASKSSVSNTNMSGIMDSRRPLSLQIECGMTCDHTHRHTDNHSLDIQEEFAACLFELPKWVWNIVRKTEELTHDDTPRNTTINEQRKLNHTKHKKHIKPQ